MRDEVGLSWCLACSCCLGNWQLRSWRTAPLNDHPFYVLLGFDDFYIAACSLPPYIDMAYRPHTFLGDRSFDVLVDGYDFYIAAHSLSPYIYEAYRPHNFY